MNIVISGASRGLGKATAEKFAAGGHHLFLTSRNPEALQSSVRSLEKQFPAVKIKSQPADLSKKEEIKNFGEWLLKNLDEVDVLVNNAGSFVPGSVHNEKEGALEQMMAVNLYSAYHLTRYLLPVMMRKRSGHIFNMCSIASLRAYNNGGAYSISKFALLGFTKNLREEMKTYNIKVTAIIPGAAYTDSWAGAGIDPKRVMEANDIAEMIYATAKLSPQACVEEIVMRPQLGDL